MIRILKASAGSGKTWNLARQYLMLLLGKQDPYSYRHILAVTFTNKATDEMKDRILKELHRLAKDPQNSAYYGDFVPSLFPDPEALSEAAGRLLCNILHDYSAFAVSTIDRFFQQILRAFAREIGQFSSYAIELDKGSLVRESVDRLLDSLTDTGNYSRSLEWMTRKTLSQLEEGEGYRLDYTLRKIADRFNSEEFRVAVEKEGLDASRLYSEERLDNLEKACSGVQKEYVEVLSATAEAVFKAFEEAGLDPFDTTRHFMSNTLKKYLDFAPGDSVPALSESFRKNASDISLWFPKAKKYMEGMVTPQIEDALTAFVSLFDVEYKVYNTARQLNNQIYGFAVADDLYAEYKAVMKERNVLTIDRTNNILRDIIDGSDAPFIYEKAGVRFDNFLLDEFQDTSLVQWENFRPLIDNSVASGNKNLIVGDVKQSIYRWRQSEWDLLENQVSASFPDSTEIDKLDTNFRSCSDIVEFNNEYFQAAAEFLDQKYQSGSHLISDIYSDVRQKVHRNEKGMVEVKFCNEEFFRPAILDAINAAVEKGYRLGDITVLVRLNKEGGEIAEYLMANGIPVVSDDSLKVSSSLTVRRLVALLAGIENPEDSMARHLASSLCVEVPSCWHSLVDLCEELLRRLRVSDRQQYEAEVLYIQSFMDILLDYVSSEGNSLRGFLKKWAEDKSNISSPKTDDSVRIMTVHKSKGLDFPYVIFPSLDQITFYSFTDRWSRPDVKDTPLETYADGVYDVCLSSKSSDTLFEQRYREEMLMQYVDNINVLYVALTRASQAMTIISRMPSSGEINGFSQWTMDYMSASYERLGFEMTEDPENGTIDYMKGVLPDPVHEEESSVSVFHTDFGSWPLNPEASRLKFSADAMDFFSPDGSAGVEASNRVRGVVLHDILSRVCVPEDLQPAVRQSVLTGDLTPEQGEQACAFLAGRIADVSDRGWFPDDADKVLNEVELIDTDGSVNRPDRVVIKDGNVIVIDYKFGEHDPRYLRQIRRYADIWRRMGYENVSAVLWYVQSGEIVEQGK